MKKHRKKYDSVVVWLVNNKKQHLLSPEFLKSVPSSTLNDWKDIDFDTYYGSEYSKMLESGVEVVELFKDRRKLKKVVFTIAKSWIAIADSDLPVVKKSYDFIGEVQRLASVIPQSIVLRCFNLTKAAYDYRVSKIKLKCLHSNFGLCFKRHPLQLTAQEGFGIKQLMKMPELVTWPVTSIHSYAIRSGLVNASLSTFYKYAF